MAKIPGQLAQSAQSLLYQWL